MNLKDYAEQILFSSNLEAKLFRPERLEDDNLGLFEANISLPNRPHKLQFGKSKNKHHVFPKTSELEKSEAVAKVMHYLANHELLALEIMALVLLKFPNAPKAFRMGLAREMLEEQEHMELYIQRMNQLGMEFGEVPVNDFFWRLLKDMKHPVEFCSKMSLTFEQANLDFSRYFINEFNKTQDRQSSQLLQRVYDDEIGHVGFGLHWFKKWSEDSNDLFATQKKSLVFPLGMQRAKAAGKTFDEEGRKKAGLNDSYIEQLKYFQSSKERPAVLRYFNPEIEELLLKYPNHYQSKKAMQEMKTSLEHIPWVFSLAQDVVLVKKRPSKFFLDQFLKLDWSYPEYYFCEKKTSLSQLLKSRKWAAVEPWAIEPKLLSLSEKQKQNISFTKNLDILDKDLLDMHSGVYSNILFSEFYATHSQHHELLPATHLHPQVFTSLEPALEYLQRFDRSVIKAPLGLSGRGVFFVDKKNVSENKKIIERLLESQSFVICEAFHNRVLDFSLQAKFNRESGEFSWGMARFFTKDNASYDGGVVGGNLLSGESEDLQAFWNDYGSPKNRLFELFDDLQTFCAQKFKNKNYLSSAGIDCFVIRNANSFTIRPLVEINARHNMGFLKWQLGKKIKPGSRAVFEIVRQSSLDGSCWKEDLKHLEVHNKQIKSGIFYVSDPENAKGFVARLRVSKGNS